MLNKKSVSVLLMLFIIVTSLFATSVPVRAATTYYMSVNGNDDNSGTDSAPFATIDRFLQIAQPGDTLLIHGGTYYGQEAVIRVSGTSGNPITIKNYPNEVPVFDGTNFSSSNVGPNLFYADEGTFTQFITIEGLYIRNYWRSGINVGWNYTNNNQTLSDYKIRYCVVDNCGQNGIAIGFGNNVVIENNMVSRTGWDINTGSWSSNINLYNMVGTNNIIRNNISFEAVDVSSAHTDGNGIILDMYQGPAVGTAGATVENNLIFNNGGAAIAWTRNNNAYIYNNTCYENGVDDNYIHKGAGFVLWHADGQESFNNINLKNNIIYQSSGKGIDQSKPFSNSVFENNNISGQPGSQNPQLIDPANLDFRPQSWSPMVNTGTSSGTPNTSLYYDRNIIKYQDWGQPCSWFRWVPDTDYIIRKGGLKNCMTSISRPQGSARDIGSYEYTSNYPAVPGDVSIRFEDANNRICNSGFESTIRNWTFLNNHAIITTADKYSGSHSLVMNATGDWCSNIQKINVTPYTDYELSAYVKGNATIGLKAQTLDYSHDFTANYIVPDNTWKKYSSSFNSGNNTVMQINLMDGSAGTSYIDNVMLTKAGTTTPTPTPTATPTPTPTSTPGSNLLTNGNFSNGTSNWSTWANSPASNTFNVSNGEAVVTISNGGSSTNSLWINNSTISHSGGTVVYNISFKARAAAAKNVMVALKEEGGSYSYFGDFTKSVSTSMTQYSGTITVNKPACTLRLELYCGGNTHTTYFDDVVVTKN